MPIIILIAGLFGPRVLIVALWLLTNWFTGIFQSALIPIIGFIGFPYALLGYTVVVNWFGGVWNIWTLLFLVLAVIADLGSWWSSSGHWHWHSDEEI